MNGFIGVDDVKLTMQVGSTFSHKGAFTGKELAGINLAIEANNQREIDIIEGLIEKQEVVVDDPYKKRKYPATIFMKSNSFHVGAEKKSYILELKEKDILPAFESVQINARVFSVIKYNENLYDEEKVSRHIILRVSEADFLELRDELENTNISFKRIGVDDTPLELRVGARLYWSKHDNETGVFYKQLIHLFQIDEGSKKGLDLASGNMQNAMCSMLISLSARFELLVKFLAENGGISDSNKKALLSDGWKDLIPEKRRAELFDKLEQVEDVEKEML